MAVGGCSSRFHLDYRNVLFDVLDDELFRNLPRSEAERMGMDIHHHGGVAYVRGSVDDSTQSSLMFAADNGAAKNEEKENDNADADAGRDHGDQDQVSNNNQTRTSTEGRVGLRNCSSRCSSTMVMSSPGAL